MAWILCIFFFCAGHAFIPRLGIENDEALFAQGVYPPRAELYSLHIGRSHIPIMLMTYLGALKSVFYRLILRNFGVGLGPLRVPMLLAATISLWLFFLLLRRIAGDRAALIGCALLAGDSIYLLTACFDWGPVALQHLLLVGGALALVRFFQERSHAALAVAGFLFGLALWDKALAVWMLSGLALGGILTFPRQIFDAVTPRRAAIAAAAFLIGASPLVIYNIHSRGATFQGNFERDTAGIPNKAVMLMRTVSGEGLFGWLTAENWETAQPHEPRAAVEKASAAISALAGHPRQSFLIYGLALALLLAPLAGRTGIRLIVLALVALAVAWIQMAINRSTGGSPHHTILLWPLPQFIIAISFSAASYRLRRAGIPALAAITAVLAISNALVLNEYFSQTVRYGSGKAWSDAILPLARDLEARRAAWFFSVDWGIMDQLRFLGRGRLPLASGSDQISKSEMTAADTAYLQQIISSPDNLFIAHTPDFEAFPGRAAVLTRFAAGSSYSPEVLSTISDSFGRNVYVVYRFAK